MLERLMRPATTYSPNAEMGVSTIGPYRLNFRVRNGNGCSPVGNITGLIRLSKRSRWEFGPDRDSLVPGSGRGDSARRTHQHDNYSKLSEKSASVFTDDRRIRPSLTDD